MFPCLAFPGVSILHMMGWYVITPRKLLLTKYNELDNKSYLDLTSFTCTFFFFELGVGEGESEVWYSQFANMQYKFPRS